jgi:hypothetical protein
MTGLPKSLQVQQLFDQSLFVRARGRPAAKALSGKAAIPDHSPYTTVGIGLLGKGWPRCLELLMWIVKLALRRPYTFVVMVILMLVFGVAAIIEMSVAERCLVYSVGIDVHHDGAVLAALW